MALNLKQFLRQLSLTSIGFNAGGRGVSGEPTWVSLRGSDGTVRYLFITTGGTLSVSTTEPTANTSGGDSTLQRLTGTISSAAYLDSFSNAVEIIPAPGAGKFIQYEYGYFYHNGGTAYNAANDSVLRYTNISGAAVSATITASGFVSATAAEQRIVRNITTSLEPVVNAAVVLTTASANPTTGNYPILFDVYYRVITSKV